jgi:hypothetical protein
MDAKLPRTSNCTFPYYHDTPACISKLLLHNKIAYAITLYFFRPELRTRGRHLEERAIMAMPKAAMHECCSVIFGKD